MARFLVVEYHQAFRDLLKEVLSDTSFGGHDITAAEDDAAALRVLKRARSTFC
jgi:CheY-like chemotaxis protein